ncbi:ion channel [Reichenbachiella sp.]|uniref:ion channel n=1 Tax=Reichenbachiella sp. TaxID=2184521 RepID=UPI003B5A16C9
MKMSKSFWGQLLFAEVFTMIFVLVFLPADQQPYAYSTLYTLLFFTSALNLDKHRKKMLWVAGSAFLLEWVSQIFNLHYIHAISNVFNVLFFIFMVGMLITQISKAEKVTRRVIFEAINGYLFLGVVFSLLIILVVEIQPSAYNFSLGKNVIMSDIIYYGFVTLSTLGYGDLLPLTPLSKSLSLLTTLGGQLYLAIIIALLVGKYSNKESE